FLYQHQDIGLLELLPDPQMERYRLRAEVRHEPGQDPTNGEVGIYFAHSQRATTQDAEHCYCRVAFNDLADLFTLPTPHGRRLVRGNRLRLVAQRHPLEGLAFNSVIIGDISRFEPAPAVERPGPWRKIAVEVTPEEVRVFWEDRQIGAHEHANILKMFETLNN